MRVFTQAIRISFKPRFFEVGEHLEPELRPTIREASYRFRLANPETEEAFRALHRHAQNDVDGPLADSA